MTGRTKRLPVVPIPKQLFVAAMRDDVIHLAGCCDQPKLFTVLAERVALKERFAFAPPPSGIVELASRCDLGRALRALPSLRIRLPLVRNMFRAPRLPFLCKFITAWKGTEPTDHGEPLEICGRDQLAPDTSQGWQTLALLHCHK